MYKKLSFPRFTSKQQKILKPTFEKKICSRNASTSSNSSVSGIPQLSIENITPILDENKSKVERIVLLSSLFTTMLMQQTMQIMNENQNYWTSKLNENQNYWTSKLKAVTDEKEDKLVHTIEEKAKLLKDAAVDNVKLQNENSELTEKLLRARGKFNIRGAVEWCRLIVAKKLSLADLDEPIDTTLARLQNDQAFMKLLTDACNSLQLRGQDVGKCLGGLYHKLSKDHHGINGEVAIYENDWVIGERVALVCLFHYCNFKFTYYDANGKLAKCPISLPVNPTPAVTPSLV